MTIKAVGVDLAKNVFQLHGVDELGRAVVRTATRKTDLKSIWINNLRERRGFNKTVIAVANKNARIMWAVLRREEPYRRSA